MTDLRGECPHCDHEYYAYKHLVDHFGMGKSLPCGTYDVKCQNPYCNQLFKIIKKSTVESVI